MASFPAIAEGSQTISKSQTITKASTAVSIVVCGTRVPHIAHIQSSAEVTRTVVQSLSHGPLRHHGLVGRADIFKHSDKQESTVTYPWPTTSPLLAVRSYSFGMLSAKGFLSCNSSGVHYLSLVEGGITDIDANSLGVFLDLQLLYMDYNNLSHVKKDWFSRLRRSSALVVLSLSHNKIVDIESESFARLGMLRVLSLEHNRLRDLRSEWFYGLTNLTRLNLFSNRLGTLSKTAFVFLTELKQLDMRENELINLPKGFRWPQKNPLYHLSGRGLLGAHDPTFEWHAIVMSDLPFVQISVNGLSKYPTHADRWFRYETRTKGGTRLTTYGIGNGYGKLAYSQSHAMEEQKYPVPFLIIAAMEGEDMESIDNMNYWCRRFWAGDDIYVNNQKQANSTGARVVTCVLVSGMNKSEASFQVFETKRGEPETVHVRHNISDQSWNNNTAVNKTDLNRDSTSIENSTTSHPQGPTHIDVTVTVQSELPDQEQPVLSDGVIFVIIAGIFLDAVVGACVVRMLVKRRCPTRRHDDRRHDYENADDDPHIYCEIPDVPVGPPTRPVVPDTRGVGQASTSRTAEDDDSSYSEIPDDYFNFNNPGYRYHRNSLPLDDHDYWPILDEFYGYENTGRLANWRPSSLPLTFEATYENVKYENVGRWQRKPSDIDYTPMNGKVGKNAGGITSRRPATEDAETLASWRPSSLPLTLEVTYENVPYVNVGRWPRQPSNEHPDYRNAIHLCEFLGYTPLMTTGKVRKKTDAVARGRPATKRQRSRDVIMIGGYGTESRSSVVESGGHNMAARVGWRVRQEGRDNTSYDVAKGSSDRRRSAYQSPRRVSVSRSNNRAYKSHWKWGRASVHKYWNQDIPLSVETRTWLGRVKSGRRHSL
ncbi:hypothetical protein Bbelb_256520 [Branchiostoma belcheri]|nr:hypothetical protein Bbelb_256520 [Branchiostoma belcheri]